MFYKGPPQSMMALSLQSSYLLLRRIYPGASCYLLCLTFLQDRRISWENLLFSLFLCLISLYRVKYVLFWKQRETLRP